MSFCGGIQTKRAAENSAALLSEWPDSNGRPLAPHARMLANCTTPRLLCGCKDTNVFHIIVLFPKKKLSLQRNNYKLLTINYKLNKMEHIECLIIGSGPAGYTAAIYTCRADVKTVVYEGMQPGGQLTQTTEIENFPGYPNGVKGPEMMEEIRQQALRFGAEIREGEVTSIDVSQRPFKVTTEYDGELLADSIIVSTGAAARYLGIPSEEEFKGGGVSACATCDGFFYKGKDVAVVGGGDTACEDATYLAKLCNKVYLIVRRDVLRASKAMQHRVLNTPNIEVLWKHQTKELFGEQQGFMKKLKGAVLYHSDTKEERTIYVDGFFEAIGHTPNTEPFKGILDMDEEGYIITKPKSTATNVEGIFACGDCQDRTYRQAIVAAGTGAMAGIEVERFLAENK